jgi:hypothetical protein
VEELAALAQVARERKQVISTLFRGKRVTSKVGRLKDKVVLAGQKVVEGSKQASNAQLI